MINKNNNDLEILSLSFSSLEDSSSLSSSLSSSSSSSSSSSLSDKNDNNNNFDTKNSVNDFVSKDFVNLCKNYDYIPTIHPKTKRIIVLGDIHGDKKLAIKLLKIAKVISVDEDENITWIGGDTVVVQVGDQIDRCRPHSINSLSGNIFGSIVDNEESDIKIMKL